MAKTWTLEKTIFFFHKKVYEDLLMQNFTINKNKKQICETVICRAGNYKKPLRHLWSVLNTDFSSISQTRSDKTYALNETLLFSSQKQVSIFKQNSTFDKSKKQICETVLVQQVTTMTNH